MFAFLSNDVWTTEELRFLAPHYGAWKLSDPRAIGDNMPLTKPVVSSVVNYLYNYTAEQKVPDQHKLDQMKRMFTMEMH